MTNSFTKNQLIYKILCPSKDDALNACHKPEYEIDFWNYIKWRKDILETEIRPSIGQSQRILVEDVGYRAFSLGEEHYAEFTATLNLEDLFASQFP